MNIEDFKKLSTEDAFAAAGKLAGIEPSVFDGIWRTESGRGKSMVSPAGAQGHFQIMPKTQGVLEKRFGRKIDPHNFHDALFGAAELMRENVRRFGNVEDALRAYNGGWDPRTWGNPETAAYAGKVLGRDAPVSPVSQVKATERAKALDAAAPKGDVASALSQPATNEPWDTRLKSLLGVHQEAEQAYQKSGFTSKAQAAFNLGGIASAVYQHLHTPDFEAQQGYRPDPKEMQGYTADEIADMNDARSPQEFEWRRAMIGYERNDQEELGRSGVGVALAASLFASLPEAIVTGKAVAAGLNAIKLGSQAAAAAGQGGKAVAMSALENVGGNVAMTAVEDAMGRRVSGTDYAVAAAGGLVGMGLDVPGVTRGAALAAERQLGLRVAQEAVERRKGFETEALNNLGDAAEPEALAKEATRLEAEALNRQQSSHFAAKPENERLLPDMEKLTAEAEVALAEKPAKGADVSADPVARPNTIEAENVEIARVPRPDWMGPVDDVLRDVKGQEVPHQRFDAHTMLSTLGTSARSNEVRLIAQRLAQALPEGSVPVMQVAQADIARTSSNAVDRAFYAPSRHGIIVPDSDMRPGKEGVILHEAAHAATVYKLRYGVANPNSAHGKLAAELEGIRQQALAELKNRPDLKMDGSADYLLQNLDEFVAGLYSTRAVAGQFIDLLKSIKVDKDETLLTKFVTAIRDLLGIKPEETTAFIKALGLSDKLMDTNLNVVLVRKSGIMGSTVDAKIAMAPGDPIAVKYGLNNLPEDTPALAAEKKALIHLYTKADQPEAPWNNIPKDRIDSLTTKSEWTGSTGLMMLKSDNPVARMVAYELVETTTGAGGRHTTAALSKYLAERKAMGNVINELQDVYSVWRNAQGGSIAGDFTNGKHWKHFNRVVAEEIEARRMGIPTEAPATVKKAADSIEAAYDRLRVMQVEGKTPGWGALPESSKGYMPHKMSPEKIANMSKAQSDALHDALIEQFVSVEGWDISFSANLAGKYVDRVRRRALGGYDSNVGQHSPGAADIVEDALKAMGLSRDEILAQMTKYRRGAASHTKNRIQLDMLKEYDDPESGTKFTLMDLFDTDHLSMVRSQVQRVSGEVALARFGIMGKSGLQLIRQAMDHGFSGQRVKPNEREAFDQVAAEFLGEPFGNHGGKWMHRAIQANSLIRLGGMGFTQTAEYINAAAHLGVGHMLSALGGFSRLRAEAAALAKGATSTNPILTSIEKMGGAEFGTDSYKMVFPFDNPGMEYQVAGRDHPGVMDRLLRGGMHAQGKLSFWRAVHSAQQRGMAEQIVLKSLRYIREGGADKALEDMGMTADVVSAMKAEYNNLVKLDGNGNVVGFDITKMENLKAAEAFIQAVHRGTSQIIQGTFIGETGKWAHEGWLKLITQFRTFSLVSVEKQWGRNRANHGLAKAFGILMGSMAMASPIYMARVYAASIGRPDQDEYLERRLAPAQIARASMNYVASSGLAGDFVDALGSVAGYSTTGGRVGNGTGFVGEVIAPAAGLADDVWKSIQDTDKDGTNIHGLVKNMPMANLPFLIPIINLLKD